MPTRLAMYSKCSMNDSMEWRGCFSVSVVCGAASMPMTPPLSAHALKIGSGFIPRVLHNARPHTSLMQVRFTPTYGLSAPPKASPDAERLAHTHIESQLSPPQDCSAADQCETVRELGEDDIRARAAQTLAAAHIRPIASLLEVQVGTFRHH